MQGNFTYSNPVRVHFGEDSLQELNRELQNYGDNVVLVYGGGSIKKNGLYDEVIDILEKNGKTVTEIAGVMPNPTIDKLREGIAIARPVNPDLILAVGGGSVIDYAKALSVSINEEEDPWEKYFVRFEEPDVDIIPVGAVLTMAGTGSEMNAGSVITNPEQNLKIGHVFADEKVMPRFSILNPEVMMSLPRYQMTAGIYDAFNHIMEQYFSGTDDNVSDYLSEGLMKSIIHASRIANENPQDYEARSNLAWAATLALNTLLSRGKATDWEIHMLGQAVSAITNDTHGMTLAAVTLPYYRYIMDAGLPKFKRFAIEVWGVDPTGKSDEEIAEEGLKKMEAWMKELGLTTTLGELGVKEDQLEDIAKATLVMEGGYRKLDDASIRQILKESL